MTEAEVHAFEETEIEACARAAHEANRAYCIANGDTSQVSWEEAPDWQRKSAREGVLGALGGATPEQSHESWLGHKVQDGWKYGPIKNAELKVHPCMVPYAALPVVQRAKDAIFTVVVGAVGEAFRVVRSSPR